MKVRKKPIIIDALQWTGKNWKEMIEFCHSHMAWEGDILTISTLEGRMRAGPGDYIMRGIRGELYPCRKDIFEETYEIVEAEGAKP